MRASVDTIFNLLTHFSHLKTSSILWGVMVISQHTIPCVLRNEMKSQCHWSLKHLKNMYYICWFNRLWPANTTFCRAQVREFHPCHSFSSFSNFFFIRECCEKKDKIVPEMQYVNRQVNSRTIISSTGLLSFICIIFKGTTTLSCYFCKLIDTDSIKKKKSIQGHDWIKRNTSAILFVYFYIYFPNILTHLLL